ncbi:transcriptional regulator [Thioclava sp. SK-1]|uniref:LysR substrate-binding domain-containing protein n=1 Tax=Thioclava sp. SK-1 TaxID=1889770 RepID=UPI0008242E38|nr:LysR substrate-binding domain-containing protein [Thioclava sp. SK-1]OCX61711.1 transcriptional regulator [Thioclava sp. SK-1]
MLKDINLNAMNHFEAVARLGGISRAAEELGVSPSAVSQQIRQFEQQFGVRLFRRDKRRLSLTLDGERLFQTTTQAFRMMRDVRSAIQRQRQNRHFILRVSPSFAVRWLSPRLNAFLALAPDWDIRIDAAPDFSDFETEVVDLDLRYGEGGWSGLHQQPVVHDLVLPMCSPGYLAQLRARSDDPIGQLLQARLIDSVKTHCRWDFWLAQQGVMGERMVYPLRFDRSSMAIQLAADGAGVVLESTTLALNELESGALVPLSTAFEVIRFPAYWLVAPSRHTSRRIVRIFSEWMRDEGAAHDARATALMARLDCKIKDQRGRKLPGEEYLPDEEGDADASRETDES